MKGNISVESKENVGSTFTLTVPFIKGNVKDLDDSLNLKKISTPQQDCMIEGTVLLAEDHIDNRRLIARLLNRLGLNVITAKNGKEAVELALEHSPELILLDIQMPEMDGYETTKRIRGHLNFKEVPIIAMTANAMPGDKQRCIEAGMNDHIPKPFEPETVANTILEWTHG